MGVRERVFQKRRKAFTLRDPPEKDISDDSKPTLSVHHSPSSAADSVLRRRFFLPFTTACRRRHRRNGRPLLVRISFPETTFSPHHPRPASRRINRRQREVTADQHGVNVGACSHEETVQRHYLLCSEPCQACRSE